MNHLMLGIWIWIGGMPIVGMIVLRWMRREPKPEDALGPRTYRRMKKQYDEMDDTERNLIAVLMAIFWPGVLVLLILLFIATILLIEEAWRRYKRGERPPPDAGT